MLAQNLNKNMHNLKINNFQNDKSKKSRPKTAGRSIRQSENNPQMVNI